MSTANPPFYKQIIIKRLPQTDEELWWSVQGLWGFRIPRTPVCPGHASPFQAFADAFFARYPVTVWKASRGFGGKTRALGILGMTEAALLGSEVSILGGSGAQSMNVHQTGKQAWRWHNAPKQLLSQEPTRFDTDLKNGGHIHTLMASQTSVRGPHPARLRLDEIDEMDQDILEAAQGQPMRQAGPHGLIETQTVMSSTHQYPDGTMTAMIKEAHKKGWPVYEWCWRESANGTDGWLTHDEVERKRSEVSQRMWDTEYELQEPSVEGRAIDTAAVERCFDRQYGDFTGDQAIKASKVQGRRYLTSVDWAKKVDQTVITTWDTTSIPWMCVGWQKINKAPWGYMINRAVDQWQHYGGSFIHDATGIGDVVDDWIKDNIASPLRSLITGVIMSAGRERSNMFTEYIAAIETDQIRYPMIKWAYDEHRYVTVEDLFGGSGHPPDSFVAGALAWYKRMQRMVIGLPTGGTKEPGWQT